MVSGGDPGEGRAPWGGTRGGQHPGNLGEHLDMGVDQLRGGTWRGDRASCGGTWGGQKIWGANPWGPVWGSIIWIIPDINKGGSKSPFPQKYSKGEKKAFYFSPFF